jgi:hypothetical protein
VPGSWLAVEITTISLIPEFANIVAIWGILMRQYFVSELVPVELLLIFIFNRGENK